MTSFLSPNLSRRKAFDCSKLMMSVGSVVELLARVRATFKEGNKTGQRTARRGTCTTTRGVARAAAASPPVIFASDSVVLHDGRFLGPV